MKQIWTDFEEPYHEVLKELSLHGRLKPKRGVIASAPFCAVCVILEAWQLSDEAKCRSLQSKKLIKPFIY